MTLTPAQKKVISLMREGCPIEVHGTFPFIRHKKSGRPNTMYKSTFNTLIRNGIIEHSDSDGLIIKFYTLTETGKTIEI